MNLKCRPLGLILFLGLSVFSCAEESIEPQIITPVHVFEVDFEFVQPEHLSRHMSGMQGSPAPLIAGDGDLVDVYSANIFGVIRVGQDVFCNYSLEGIFDNPEKPTADPASYNFEGIDYLLQGVRDAGAAVLWQASYDIGYDGTCDVIDGRHAGSGPVADPLKHAEAVSFVLRHFNNDTDWDVDAQDFNVKHVEFVNDPFGLGGYTDSDEELYMDDFTAFAQGVKAAFAADSEEINILGPAHRIRSIDESFPTQNSLQKSFLLKFVDRVAGTGLPIDMLTVQTRFDNAYNSAIALGNLRKYMDELGLTDLPIWVTEVGPSPELEEQLRAAGDIDFFSAYWGAHLTASKIAWQRTVARTFPHRGNRRTTAPNSGAILESPFFTEDGQERQAVQPFTAFLIIRNQPILDGSSVTSDGTALLAVRHKDKNKMWLLVGNPGDGLSPSTYPLNVEIENMPKSVSTVSYKYSVVDATTGDKFEFSQKGDLEVLDEKVVFEHIIPTPSTIFVELEW